MLHKAIIEEQIDQYQFRVRIPLIHRIKDSKIFTPTESLPIATVSINPNTHIHIQVGDIVIIGFVCYNC